MKICTIDYSHISLFLYIIDSKYIFTLQSKNLACHITLIEKYKKSQNTIDFEYLYIVTNTHLTS